MTSNPPDDTRPGDRGGPDPEGKAAAGAGLRWAIALFLLAGLLLLLFAGPGPPG